MRVIKVVLGLVMLILFALVTFFGLGPVLFADGSDQERMITLGIVLVVYVALAIVTYFIFRKR
ncbi:DUF6954 family protein [Paenibacillus montanisoli]|uniref:DUF6954 family protein n=1 Tax=Paenibacillus montanisoli TaxID=2081970 RepID=UPI00105760CF|nr:hypothetical protein [Paenibacillus montanisoli]